MSKEERKVPELRFKGFYDDWEQRKLFDIADFYSGGTPSVTKKEYYDGGIPFIRSAEINSRDTKLSLSDSGLKNSSAKLVSKGDILYALYGATSGEVGISKIDGAINQAILAIKLKNLYSSLFILNWLKKSKEKIVRKFLQGGQGNLSSSIIKNLNVKIPDNISEQNKIGRLIESIDEIIELHRRKRTILQKIKQIYLVKMNPKKEKLSPELYFLSCSKEWKQSKLNSLCKITMGHSPKSENYTSNSEDYILVQGNADIKDGWVKPRVWTTQVTSRATKGSILLSVRAPVGNVGKTSYDVVIGRGIASIEGDEFIYQLLNKMHIENYWRKYSTGSTFESINSKDIKDALVKVPNNKEREKIGFFLKVIDSYIVQHNNIIDSLVKLKKSYLTKMFL